MRDHTTVSGAAREVSERLGKPVRPRDLSDLFYSRVLSDEKCPILGGRRLIPLGYLEEIEQILRGQIETGSSASRKKP
jgi:hypothetical protein